MKNHEIVYVVIARNYNDYDGRLQYSTQDSLTLEEAYDDCKWRYLDHWEIDGMRLIKFDLTTNFIENLQIPFEQFKVEEAKKRKEQQEQESLKRRKDELFNLVERMSKEHNCSFEQVIEKVDSLFKMLKDLKE